LTRYSPSCLDLRQEYELSLYFKYKLFEMKKSVVLAIILISFCHPKTSSAQINEDKLGAWYMKLGHGWRLRTTITAWRINI